MKYRVFCSNDPNGPRATLIFESDSWLEAVAFLVQHCKNPPFSDRHSGWERSCKNGWWMVNHWQHGAPRNGDDSWMSIELIELFGKEVNP